MTPMKRLSSGINEFRLHTKDYFKEVNLNKSAPKYNLQAWVQEKDIYSKGVVSDFLMLFNANIIDQSFAIAFTYIGLPVEEHKVEVTIKKGESNKSIVSSGELSIEEFKAKLNKMNKEFQEKSYINRDEVSILEKVSKIFLNKNYDLKNEIKRVTKDMNHLVEEKRKEYDINNLEIKVVNTISNYDSAEKKANKAIERSNEKKEVEALEILLAEAKKKLNLKTTEIEIKYQLKELKLEKNKAKTEFMDSSETMNKEVEKEKDKFKNVLGKGLKR